MTSTLPDFSKLPSHDVPWLLNLRKESFESFQAQGWPTPRVEAWKYTNLSKFIQENEHEILSGTPHNPSTPLEVFSAGCNSSFHLEAGSTGRRVLSVDFPEGVRITPLSEAIAKDDGFLQNLFSDSKNSTDALNLALMHDGVFIDIADDAVIDDPLIIFSQRGEKTAQNTFIRNVIRMGKNAKATILENHVGKSEQAHKIVSFTHFDVADNATLKHIRVQNENAATVHLGQTEVTLARDASYEANTLDIGSHMARHETTLNFNGTGAKNHIHNIVLAQGKQHIDNAVFINHNQPHCESGVCVRNVVDDKAQAVFQGKFYVAKDAQQTDAEMLCRNLLLSDHARASAKPELEIYADDVKCAHGATTGKLDDAALFYLQSRGIAPRAAKSLLTYGFVANLLENIKDEDLHEQLTNLIDKWMASHT